MKLGTGSSTDLDFSVFGLIILPGLCSGIMQLSPQILKEEIKLDQHPSPSDLHPPSLFPHTHTHKPVFLPLSVATRAEDVGQLPQLPSSLAVPPPVVFPGPLAAYHTDVEHHLHHAVEPRGQQKKEEEEEGEEEGRRRKRERRKGGGGRGRGGRREWQLNSWKLNTQCVLYLAFIQLVCLVLHLFSVVVGPGSQLLTGSQ